MTDSVQLDQMTPGGIFEMSAGAPTSYGGLTVFPLISEPGQRCNTICCSMPSVRAA